MMYKSVSSVWIWPVVLPENQHRYDHRFKHISGDMSLAEICACASLMSALQHLAPHANDRSRRRSVAAVRWTTSVISPVVREQTTYASDGTSAVIAHRRFTCRFCARMLRRLTHLSKADSVQEMCDISRVSINVKSNPSAKQCWHIYHETTIKYQTVDITRNNTSILHPGKLEFIMTSKE